MATKETENPGIDVRQTRVKIKLERARPGEETEVFVSNGRKNVQVLKGVEVEVPYWVADRLRQKEYAEERAYKYETMTEKRATEQP